MDPRCILKGNFYKHISAHRRKKHVECPQLTADSVKCIDNICSLMDITFFFNLFVQNCSSEKFEDKKI